MSNTPVFTGGNPLSMNNQIQGIGMTSQRTRDRLVERLRAKGIQNERVLEVIRTTPRHLFIDEALAHRAYEDSSLPIGQGQTISQPYIVARMTEIILEQGVPDKVLEVGTGFHPEFTGVQNVRIAARLLGVPAAAIEARMDEVLAFAEIGDFAVMHDAPVGIDILPQQVDLPHALPGECHNLRDDVIERSTDLFTPGIGHDTEGAVFGASFHDGDIGCWTL